MVTSVEKAILSARRIKEELEKAWVDASKLETQLSYGVGQPFPFLRTAETQAFLLSKKLEELKKSIESIRYSLLTNFCLNCGNPNFLEYKNCRTCGKEIIKSQKF